jgi:hypothetical protein
MRLRAASVTVTPYGLKMFGADDPEGYRIALQEAPG